MTAALAWCHFRTEKWCRFIYRGQIFLLRPSPAFGYNPGMRQTANGRFLEWLLEPVSSALNEEAARKLIGLKAVIGRFKTGHLWALQNRPGK